LGVYRDEGSHRITSPPPSEAGTRQPQELAGQDSLSLYLNEAGGVPLLDPAREVELADRIDRSRRALGELLRRLAKRLGSDSLRLRAPRSGSTREWPLAEVDRLFEDVVRLCRSRRDAGTARLLGEARRHKLALDRARENLILANLRLVVHVAKDYLHRGLPMADLVQEGNLGLMKAVDRYDTRRGTRFSTFAYWWIRQAIQRAIGNDGRTVRVPVHVQDTQRKIRRAAESLRAHRRREATLDELAGELRLPVSKIRRVLRAARAEDPLEDSERVIDHLHREPDPSAVCPFEQVLEKQRRQGLAAALRTLNEQERRVIIRRYGLDREVGVSLEVIGEELGLSRTRVRQIERRALAKIEASRRSPGLRDLASGREANRKTG
jgi:RNA polymerase sigma factor (sigma-70 family)